MKKTLILGALSGLTALAALGAFASDAHACGGCFPPPGDNASVVTDHRMVLSVSTTQTTLYDQIRYAGNPAQFAWVLPISGEAKVGLSSDALFQVLDNLSATVVQAPPLNCPSPPSNCRFPQASAFGGDSAGGADAGRSSVEVTKRETVGPYDTVQLKSTDADALTKWLTDNGFGIPDDIKPIIAQYVTEKYDFLAMKLIPGAGVNAMRPVRITTTGSSPTLPLRMVAAGTGKTVGITLWTVADARWDPKNFGTFRIKDEEIVWDWATQKSNYATIRQAKTAESGGLAWELESSLGVYQQQVRSALQNSRFVFPDGGADYLPPTGVDGGPTGSSDEALAADLETLFTGVSSQFRLTRIRADLARAGLATDLYMEAKDQTNLPNLRFAKQESGQPLCPVYSGCEQVGTAPRDEAIARTQANNSESFSCATPARIGFEVPVTLAGIAAFLGAALWRVRRKRA